MQEEQAQQAELGNLERSNQALQRDVARFEEREKLTQEVIFRLAIHSGSLFSTPDGTRMKRAKAVMFCISFLTL